MRNEDTTQPIKSTNVRSISADSLFLYTAPLSMFSAKVEIALREKGLSYACECVPFSIANGYHPKSDAVLAANPKGQVPVLVAGDLSLYDSTQIFEFLEDVYPDCPLWPGDLQARALARQWEHWSDEVFFLDSLKLRDRHLSREDRLVVASIVSRHLDILDAQLAGRAYVADSYSFADIALFLSEMFSVVFGLPRMARTNIDLWRARLIARPAIHTIVEPMAHFAEDIGVARAGTLLNRQGTTDDR